MFFLNICGVGVITKLLYLNSEVFQNELINSGSSQLDLLWQCSF